MKSEHKSKKPAKGGFFKTGDTNGPVRFSKLMREHGRNITRAIVQKGSGRGR